MAQVRVQKALLSVFDKSGLEPLARALHQGGVQLYSTGGTYKYLTEDLKLPATKVDSITEFPEMMDGRVKTLHPKIFGGILARRSENADIQAAQTHGIPLFDLIVVNLYDFASTLGKPREEQVRLVDIGGPAMLRAASKNHEAVAVLSDPADYPPFLKEFAAHSGQTTLEFRFGQAVRTFERTARYDAAIVAEWRQGAGGFADSLSLTPQTPLRYGENPHQKAAWAGPSDAWDVLQGKELSYNNLLDTEAAVRVVLEFKSPALSIIKHNNPCGVATGEFSSAELFARAFAADSKSAFGGIVACNRPVDAQAARAIGEIFLEVVAAPEFSEEALQIFSQKKNLRLVRMKNLALPAFEVRAAMGGWLMQQPDAPGGEVKLQTVTKTPLPVSAESDLRFAWKVVKHVRSNAIALAKNGVTVSLGGGQTSRVDAVQIALSKATPDQLQGAVLASDAFFPFRDNIDLLKGLGIAAIVQPGGSKRDDEVIAACDELGIAMAFTGTRHFRH
ncbi:bifunctional phosphoribosylaminoimidazolecarboxamide formyltransferase/IMP cyclohydrolase [bacterium]|nr:bifunctional phosphoribosylaminoimidazolecarboxamide formyltransferase/IMP cyclohydrolase [bacterium]